MHNANLSCLLQLGFVFVFTINKIFATHLHTTAIRHTVNVFCCLTLNQCVLPSHVAQLVVVSTEDYG